MYTKKDKQLAENLCSVWSEISMPSIPPNMQQYKGAMIGAGVGALGTAGMWAMKRMQLNKKLRDCNGEPNCVQRVQNEIRDLRNRSLMTGAAAMAGGAAIGHGIQKYQQNQAPTTRAQTPDQLAQTDKVIGNPEMSPEQRAARKQELQQQIAALQQQQQQARNSWLPWRRV